VARIAAVVAVATVIAHAVQVGIAGYIGLAGQQAAIGKLAHAHGIGQLHPFEGIDIHPRYHSCSACGDSPASREKLPITISRWMWWA
jgi:hypothetical protein